MSPLRQIDRRELDSARQMEESIAIGFLCVSTDARISLTTHHGPEPSKTRRSRGLGMFEQLGKGQNAARLSKEVDRAIQHLYKKKLASLSLEAITISA